LNPTKRNVIEKKSETEVGWRFFIQRRLAAADPFNNQYYIAVRSKDLPTIA
jgi:hypothetical protein